MTIDAPGHGESAGVDADLDTAADLAVESIGRGIYLGYSMGGRVALHAALAHHELVRGLVLVSTTAGLETDSAREARRTDDEALAAHIEILGVDRFLDEWLALALFAGLDDSARFVAERRTNTASGLASSLRLAGLGTQRPLWERLGELSMPVLVVAGSNDDKFCQLARRLADGIGASATLELIDGAGHTAHLEQPDVFATVLDHWLGPLAAQK